MSQVQNPQRCIVGLCPQCGKPVVITNDNGTWPLATCDCDWRGGVDELDQAVLAQRQSLEPLR